MASRHHHHHRWRHYHHQQYPHRVIIDQNQGPREFCLYFPNECSFIFIISHNYWKICNAYWQTKIALDVVTFGKWKVIGLIRFIRNIWKWDDNIWRPPSLLKFYVNCQMRFQSNDIGFCFFGEHIKIKFEILRKMKC